MFYIVKVVKEIKVIQVIQLIQAIQVIEVTQVTQVVSIWVSEWMKYTFRLTVKPIITGSSIDRWIIYFRKTVNSENIIDITNSYIQYTLNVYKMLKLQKCIYFTLSRWRLCYKDAD